MTHTAIQDLAAEVEIQPGSVVSKVVHHDDLELTVFGFDAGQGLSEHRAPRPAVVQVLRGRLRFTADEEVVELRPGSWLHMAPDTPHALEATEPTIMVLTLRHG